MARTQKKTQPLTTAQRLSSIVKSCRDIMRKDKGLNGDLEPLRDRLDGRYLVHLLNSGWIKDRVSDKSRGDMIPHIVLREIRAFPVPLPQLHEQHRIVRELDQFQSGMVGLRTLQTQTGHELDALLPSVLDRCFWRDS